MKTLAIVQARMGSTRLPKKVMLPINRVPLIELLLHRLALAKRIDHIVVATSTAHGDKPLAAIVRGLGVEVFEGSENDVLDRFYNAAKAHQPEIVLRITGDCPLVDPELVDEMVAYFGVQNVEYLSNGAPPTFPDGLDIEVFSFRSLEQAACSAGTPDEREHVTPFIRESGRFTIANFTNVRIYHTSGGQWTKRRTSRW